MQGTTQIVVFLDDRCALLFPIGGGAQQVREIGQVARVLRRRDLLLRGIRKSGVSIEGKVRQRA